MKKHIPNLFTLLNLLSGMIAVLMAATDELVYAAYFVFLGIFFDFFDGFFARKFKVEGELGKQLDSLADVVTSGVVPGIVMFQMMLYASKERWFMELSCEVGNWTAYQHTYYYFLPFTGLFITLAAAYRLANFNIDERQTSSFIGLPTPAFSIFVMSLPLILFYGESPFFIDAVQNIYVLLVVTIAGCYLMNAEIPLFSLKFKTYSWAGNEIKYFFLVATIVLLFTLKMVAIPLVIIFYIVMSIIDNSIKKQGAKKI
ncbi:CDP-alcohol phosphatidyltransferase family protein [Lutimonas zeaxanthinifaciens]|uniref:CDP-alcohol phosphatidyltransferase family protein n=1 Tax=Lutimonas zeaxanthinifaciens TaxID=3060215 RepID=UPI00265D4957|nr:CDP-alcohol phosphatidyltransferase family protein [Lutimonas sp. YSD2104]WKK67434.1 CDP-alcohol phosphatidyltransferase family protein [Lutimonas sp. YSD2104]